MSAFDNGGRSVIHPQRGGETGALTLTLSHEGDENEGGAALTTEATALPEVPEKFKPFKIRPQLLDLGKTSNSLIRGEVISCGVQVIAHGGETNLHAHRGNEAIWIVLGGRAKFYTTDDQVVAELGQYEALYIPESTPYWFESASEENLVILRLGANVPGKERGRIDYGERQYATRGSEEGYVKRPVEVREGAFFGG